MVTTAKGIVPDPTAKGQKQRKPLSKAHRAKLVKALNAWRRDAHDPSPCALRRLYRGAHDGEAVRALAGMGC